MTCSRQRIMNIAAIVERLQSCVPSNVTVYIEKKSLAKFVVPVLVGVVVWFNISSINTFLIMVKIPFTIEATFLVRLCTETHLKREQRYHVSTRLVITHWGCFPRVWNLTSRLLLGFLSLIWRQFPNNCLNRCVKNISYQRDRGVDRFEIHVFWNF